MKKVIVLICIAISYPIIQALDSLGTSKPVMTKVIKPRFKTVPDWSKIKSPKKLKYYEHLYNTSK